MKQRIYVDTSVFGGYYDEEFAEFTIPLFGRVMKGDFTLLFSAVTERELDEAPTKVKQLVVSIPETHTEFVELSEVAVNLASEYIAEKVVGQTSYADCLHIALATIHHADVLVSWNFKHIVNMQRIRGYNSVNIKHGYKQLEIRSPREFQLYEDPE